MKLSFKHLMALPSGNYNLLIYVANVDEFYLFSIVDPVVSERGCTSYTQGKAKKNISDGDFRWFPCRHYLLQCFRNTFQLKFNSLHQVIG